MIDRDLIDRYKFFKQHDGWSTPPGRAACALRSARTERLLERAIELGVAEVAWPYDDEPYEAPYYMTDEECGRMFDSGRWTGPFGCVLTINGDDSASLWGIVLDSRETDDPYARCVATDLAAECEDELRQAIGDAEDVHDGIMLA